MKSKLEEVSPTFKSFIDLEDNHRIIFSAKFGAGKTYFLKSFFKEYSASYEAVFLYPVNYQVCANEDIFELVKFDLLRSLLKILPKRKLSPDDYKRSADKLKTLKNNEQGVLKKLLKLTSKLTRGVTVSAGLSLGLEASLDLEISQIINNFIELSEKDPKEQNTEPTAEEELIASFLEDIEDRQKLYEDTAITRFIKDATKRIKKEGNKKLVLVIDDFDRIDPEHIFRLLNIFSAHLEDHDEDLMSERDINSKEEKKLADRYGFDRVIFVCDIDNIQSIFHHKYGLETDFNGYIDKFYSKAIFEFSNQNTIKNKLSSVLEHFYEANKGINIDILYIKKIAEGGRVSADKFFDLLREFLSSFLERAITDKIINFRDIERLYGSKLLQEGRSLKDYLYLIDIENKHGLFALPEIVLFEFLIIVFGNTAAIIKYLDKPSNDNGFDPVHQIFIDQKKLFKSILLLASCQGNIRRAFDKNPLSYNNGELLNQEIQQSFYYRNFDTANAVKDLPSKLTLKCTSIFNGSYLRPIVTPMNSNQLIPIGGFATSLEVLSEANLLN
jgi:hypothetical protein